MTAVSDVLADPRDMDLRLRYADAVTRTDPDHAGLIRLQIAHDRLAIAGDPVRDPAAVRRVRDLVATLARRLSASIGESPTGTFIRRGFAEILTMSGAEFLSRGAELSGSVPWRGAVLSGVDAAVAADLARSPLLARLDVLDLSDNALRDDGLKALLASPHLGRVRWLGLNRCRIDVAGAHALGASAREVLPELRYLGFVDNRIMVTPFLIEVASTVYPLSPDLEAYRPGYGDFLDAEFGPFAWLTDAHVRFAPDYTQV